VLLALIAIAYQIGLSKSRSLAGKGNNSALLHSRPGYYGALVALWCGIPFFNFDCLEFGRTQYFKACRFGSSSSNFGRMDEASIEVLMNRVKAIASGFGVTDQPAAYELAAAATRKVQTIGSYAKLAVVICAAIVGLLIAKNVLQTILEHVIKLKKLLISRLHYVRV
jgi:phosphate transport system permease protein